MIKSNRRAVTLLACVAIVVGIATMARAQQEGVYTIPSYKFEAGPQLDNVKIGYVTYGKLNDAKTNAILLVPGTSSGRHWADAYVGPGKMYDTDKYFCIGVDVIGGGNSSQPSDGLERFQPDWKRFNSNFASNFIDLTSLRYFQSA
jgi:homoserine O-acetyltransferase/O-succinyltransferase